MGIEKRSNRVKSAITGFLDESNNQVETTTQTLGEASLDKVPTPGSKPSNSLGIDMSAYEAAPAPVVKRKSAESLGIDMSAYESEVPSVITDMIIDLPPTSKNPYKNTHLETDPLIMPSDMTNRPMNRTITHFNIIERQKELEKADIYNPTEIYDVADYSKKIGANSAVGMTVENIAIKTLNGRKTEASALKNSLANYLENTYSMSGLEAYDLADRLSLDVSGGLETGYSLDPTKFDIGAHVAEYKARPSKMKAAMTSAWNTTTKLAFGGTNLAREAAGSAAIGLSGAVGDNTDVFREGFRAQMEKDRAQLEEWFKTFEIDENRYSDKTSRTVGSLLPSAAPIVVGTVISAMGAPGIGAPIAQIGTGAMISGSVGLAMSEYDEYVSQKGIEHNMAHKWATSIGQGITEYAFERAGMGGVILKGGKGKVIGATLSVKESIDLGTEAIRSYAAKNPTKWAKFRDQALSDFHKESWTEGATEIAQDIISNTYKDLEDQSSFKDTMHNAGIAYAFGGLLGAGVSPLSFKAANKQHTQRREEQGGVFFTTIDGQGVEIVEQRGDKTTVMYPDGKTEKILTEELGEVNQISVDRFEAILKAKGIENQIAEDWRIDAHAQAVAEVDQAIEEQYTPLAVKIQTEQGEALGLRPAIYAEEQVFIVGETSDGKGLMVKKMGSDKVTVVSPSMLELQPEVTLDQVRQQEVGEMGYTPDNTNGMPSVGDEVFEEGGRGKGTIISYDVSDGSSTVEFEDAIDPDTGKPQVSVEVFPRSVIDLIIVKKENKPSDPVNTEGGNLIANPNASSPTDEVRELDVQGNSYKVVNGEIVGNTKKQADKLAKDIVEDYPNLSAEVIPVTKDNDPYAKADYVVRVTPVSQSQGSEATQESQSLQEGETAETEAETEESTKKSDGAKKGSAKKQQTTDEKEVSKSNTVAKANKEEVKDEVKEPAESTTTETAESVASAEVDTTETASEPVRGEAGGKSSTPAKKSGESAPKAKRRPTKQESVAAIFDRVLKKVKSLPRVTDVDGEMKAKQTAIKKDAKEIVSTWKRPVKVVVFVNQEEANLFFRALEEESGIKMPEKRVRISKGVSGFEFMGTVFVVASHRKFSSQGLKDQNGELYGSQIAEVEDTILHEAIGHLGIQGVFDALGVDKSKLYDFLDGVVGEMNVAELNRLTPIYASELRVPAGNDNEGRPITRKPTFSDIVEGRKSKKEADKKYYDKKYYEILQEYIAYQAQRDGRKKGLVDRFVSFIVDILDNLGKKTIGRKIKGSTIRAAIKDARKFVIVGDTAVPTNEAQEATAFDIHLQQELSEVFYSPTLRAAEKITQNKATAGQWMAMLLNNGASQAELNWIGINEFFENNPMANKVDVIDYIKNNQVELKEFVNGVSEDEIERFLNDETGEGYTREEAIEYLSKIRYSPYALPGGENYKELLLTTSLKRKVPVFEIVRPLDEQIKLKEEDEKLKERAIELGLRTNNIPELERIGTPEALSIIKETEANVKRWIAISENHSSTYPVSLLADGEAHQSFPNEEKAQVYIDRITEIGGLLQKQDSYTSSHWDEPNVLAHTRIHDMIVGDEKILVVNDMQSDWAQEGRKKGFDDANNKYEKERLFKNNGEGRSNSDRELFHFIDYKNEEGQIEDTFGIPKSRFANFEDAVNYVATEKVKTSSAVPQMPFPQTSQWVNLTIRRLIRYAAENGHNRIAFINGEQAADMFDLSKQVDEVVATKRPKEDFYRITITKKDFDGEVIRENKTAEELESYLGKNLAESIIKDVTPKEGLEEILSSDKEYQKLRVDVEKQRNNLDKGEGDVREYNKANNTAQAYVDKNYSEYQSRSKEYSGLDLKVGGEGMKAFYDGILPSQAKKVLAKLDKTVKVEVIDFQESPLKVVVQDGKRKLIDASSGEIIDGQYGDRILDDQEYINTFIQSYRNSRGITVKEGLSQQLSIPITPTIKQLSLEGMPMFQDNGDGTKQSDRLHWRKSKKITDKLSSATPATLEEMVMQHFATGGRINTESLKSETGFGAMRAKDGSTRGVSEFKSRIWMHSKRALEMDNLVQQMQEFMDVEMASGTIDDSEVRDAIINVMIAYDAPSKLRTDLLEMFTVDGRLVSDPTERSYLKLQAEYEAQFISSLSDEVIDLSDVDVPFQKSGDIDSPAFKKWFGDSKVVDAEGKPMVVYHGTASDFSDFSEKLLGKNFDQSTLGFYFTNGAKPDMFKGIPYGSTASEYAFNAQEKGYAEADGANVMPVYLSIKNPLIIKGDGWYSPNTAVDKQRAEIARELESGKYDGVIAENIDTDKYGSEKIFVALKPTQIKSATGNKGQFDGNNPDIRFQKQTESQEFKDWFGKSKVVNIDGTPKVQYHGNRAYEEDDFTEFRTESKSGDQLGAHFGTTEQANEFTDGLISGVLFGSYRPKIYPVFLAINNPLRLEDYGEWSAYTLKDQLVGLGIIQVKETGKILLDMESDEREATIKAAIKKAGYDGVVYLNRLEGIPAGVFHQRLRENKITRSDALSMPDSEFEAIFGDVAKDSYIVFDPRQIKSATGNNGDFDGMNPDIRFQSEDINSPAFKKWFGNSKAVAADGSPLVVYHGTINDLDEFNTEAGANARRLGIEKGVFFSDDIGVAESYTMGARGTQTLIGANVMPVYLSMSNAKVIDAKGKTLAQLLDVDTLDYKNGTIIKNVYDSKTWGKSSTVYHVVDSASIKSAIGNNGEYSLDTSDIRFQTELPSGSRVFNEGSSDVAMIHDQYLKDKGIDSVPPQKIFALDKDRSRRISQEFVKMDNDPSNKEVAKAYSAMADETIDQGVYILDKGYKVEMFNGEGEPYENSEEMINDLVNNKHMFIFSTEGGFGEGISDKDRLENPLLKDSGLKDQNGKPLLINDVFRFVHDFYGHAYLGNGFGAVGEENAWNVHARMYSPLARRAMSVETRGQNSWVNFSGVNDEAQKMLLEARRLKNQGKEKEGAALRKKAMGIFRFADQKIGLLPEWVSDSSVYDEDIRFQKDMESKYVNVAIRSIKDGKSDGTTFNLDGTEYTGGGLVVPIASVNVPVVKLTKGMITDFVKSHKSVIPKGGGNVKVGLFRLVNTNGLLSIDLNVLIPVESREIGLQFGRLAEQESLFDMETKNEVMTGAANALNPRDFTTEELVDIVESLGSGKMPKFMLAEIAGGVLKAPNVTTIKGKDGRIYELEASDRGTKSIRAKHKGEQVGFATFYENDGALTGMDDDFSLFVNDSHRRNSVATMMYNFASKVYGMKINPANNLTEDGKGFWNRTEGQSMEVRKQDSGDVSDLIEKSNIAKFLEKDNFGNYVFYHYGQPGIKRNDPSKFGRNNKTSKDEQADRKGMPATFFYTNRNDSEAGMGSNKYEVRVPRNKVYPFNSDPLDFYDKAEENFKKDYPYQSFGNPNTQLAYITAVANENGFDMVIARWNLTKDSKAKKMPLALRAETSIALDLVDTTTGTLPTRIIDYKDFSNASNYVSILPLKEANPAYYIKVARELTKLSLIKGVKPVTSLKTAEAAINEFIKRGAENLLWLRAQVNETHRERTEKWYEGANFIAKELAMKNNLSLSQTSAILAVLSPQTEWNMNIARAESVVEVMSKPNEVFTKELAAYVKKLPITNENKGEVLHSLVDSMVGKKLSDLDSIEQAVFVRAYSEANTDRSYYIYAPEGVKTEIAIGGRPDVTKTYTWGSFSEIIKAVEIFKNKDRLAISHTIGTSHKIRNFYNNIVDPADEISVTIDTHAAAALLFQPLGQSDAAISDMMGKTASKPDGLKGLYSAYADTYRVAAEQAGILPRELQSVTWEAIRMLFDAKRFQKGLISIWDENLTRDEIREKIFKQAGGFSNPAWERSDLSETKGTGSSIDGIKLQNDGDTNGRGDGSGDTGLPSISYQKVDSPEFKKWFGDSKVVDENGKPLVVYHGTLENIEKFDQSSDLTKGYGFFSESPAQAESFIRNAKEVQEDWDSDGFDAIAAPQIYPVYLSLKNPFDFKNEDHRKMLAEVINRNPNVKIKQRYSLDEVGSSWELSDRSEFMKELGFDGAILYETTFNLGSEPFKQFIPFSPTQIKSATGNQGTFDGTNPDISYQKVDSPEFKKWFGNSEVIDKKGLPLVVYHGTKNDFNEFEAGHNSRALSPVRDYYFFSEDADIAGRYAGTEDALPLREGNIIPVFLSFQNPKRIDYEIKDWWKIGDDVDLAKKEGHDGLILENVSDIGGLQTQYVAFSSTQIKSATGNQGTFDGANPDIRYQQNEEPTPFYSNSLAAVQNILQPKATAEQWKAMLLNNGASKAELDWMGLDEFLVNNPNPTGDQVEKFIRDNQIEFKEIIYGETVSKPLRYGYLTLPAREGEVITDQKEILLTIPSIKEEGAAYVSSHWPDDKNVLVHVRIDTRVIGEKKSLMVNEIQSDWGQAKRKVNNGWEFIWYSLKGEDKIAELVYEDELHELVAYEENGWFNAAVNGVDVDTKFSTADQAMDALEKYANENIKIELPETPFEATSQWVDLALKKLIDYAVANNHDQIVLPNGFDVAEMMKIARVVDSLQYMINKNGTYRLVAYNNTGQRMYGANNVTARELDGLVGKDVAKSITEKKGEKVAPEGGVESYRLDHRALKVGGAGMKVFYNEIVPARAKKVLAKIDKSAAIEKRDYGNSDVTIVEVTRIMKGKVTEFGLPMFQREIMGDESFDTFEHKYDHIKRKYQDKSIYLKRLLDAKIKGLLIPDEMDFYTKENLAKGKVLVRFDRYQDTIGKPWLEYLGSLASKEKVSYDESSRYYKAKHIVVDNIEDGGIKIDEAKKIVAAFEKKVTGDRLKKLQDFMIMATGFELQMRREYGLISRDEFKNTSKMFKFFVPLRGFDSMKYLDPTRFTVSHARKGRSSESGDPISYVDAMIRTVIHRGEQNLVKTSFLNFIKKHPDSKLYKIKSAWYIQKPSGEWDLHTSGMDKELAQLIKDKKATQRPPDADLLSPEDTARLHARWALLDGNEKSISVIDNGTKIIIEVYDPLIVNAFKNTNYEQLNFILRKMRGAIDYLRGVYTQYSPEFAMRNFIRDSISGIINVRNDHGDAIALMVMNEIRPRGGSFIKGLGKKKVNTALASIAGGNAMAAVQRGFKGDFSGKDGKLFRDFIEIGGLTGYSDIREVSTIYNDLKKKTDGFLGTNKSTFGKVIVSPIKGFSATLDYIDDTNRIIENTVRFAAYKVLVTQKNYTPQQAAIYAKDLTVNFNRKGELSDQLGSIYMFFNAAVQGIERTFVRPLTSGKEVRNRALASFGALAAANIALSSLARMIGGEDEDGIYYYDKLPDYVRTHNFIIPNILNPGGGEFFMLPLPYGYHSFYAMGENLFGGIAFRKDSAGDIIGGMLKSFAEGVLPMGSPQTDNMTIEQTTISYVTPMVIKPVVDMAFNTNFAGGSIYKDSPFDSKSMPDSQKYFSNVSPAFKMITAFLNEASGGNQIEKGWLDFNPEKVEHVWDAYTGGVGKFIDNTVHTTVAASKGEMFQDDNGRKIPFVRNYFTEETGKYYDQGRFYDIADEIKAKNDQYREYKELAAADPKIATSMKLFVSENKKEIELYGSVHKKGGYMDVAKQLRDSRRAAEAMGNKERVRKLEEQEKRLYQSLYKVYDKE